MRAAKAFFRLTPATMGFRPDRATTDDHSSYPRGDPQGAGQEGPPLHQREKAVFKRFLRRDRDRSDPGLGLAPS